VGAHTGIPRLFFGGSVGLVAVLIDFFGGWVESKDLWLGLMGRHCDIWRPSELRSVPSRKGEIDVIERR
jgi:hypothetical protein